MVSRQHRNSTKKVFLLLTIIFFHAISIIISAYYDRGVHWEHREIVKLNELRYWLWFFTWWSAWASLLTIPWAIYKLYSTKKKSGYKEQLFDLIVAEINLISGVIYCLGGFLITWRGWDRPPINFPFLGQVNPVYIYLVHNLFWHVLAPGLSFYYFWKCCSINKLVKRKKTTLIASLINPTIYLCYVLIRPNIKIINYNKLGGPESYQYPYNYPYAFFYWSVGERAKKIKQGEENSKQFFWHNWPEWLQRFFWTSVIIILSYSTFLLLGNYLIKAKNSVDKKKWIIPNYGEIGGFLVIILLIIWLGYKSI